MNRTHQLIAQAILNGHTSKEVAFTHGVSHRGLQNQASILKVCFPYGGVGPRPKPAKVKHSRKWAECVAYISQPQTTQTK